MKESRLEKHYRRITEGVVVLAAAAADHPFGGNQESLSMLIFIEMHLRRQMDAVKRAHAAYKREQADRHPVGTQTNPDVNGGAPHSIPAQSVAQFPHLDRRIGEVLVTYQETFEALQSDKQHGSGKQATALLMAINDIKALFANG